LSNQKAKRKIKKENTDHLTRKFINKLSKLDMDCNGKKRSN